MPFFTISVLFLGLIQHIFITQTVLKRVVSKRSLVSSILFGAKGISDTAPQETSNWIKYVNDCNYTLNLN